MGLKLKWLMASSGPHQMDLAMGLTMTGLHHRDAGTGARNYGDL